MTSGLKLVIILCIIPIMVLAGIYSYKYLNNKLTSSNRFFSILFYALLLFMAMAGIYAGGLTAMAWLYDYLNI